MQQQQQQQKATGTFGHGSLFEPSQMPECVS